MVEGARLESVYRGNSIEGSNPSLSAKARCYGEQAPRLLWNLTGTRFLGITRLSARHENRIPVYELMACIMQLLQKFVRFRDQAIIVLICSSVFLHFV